MTGYDFHPEAALDLDEIWEFIADDSLDAADRVPVRPSPVSPESVRASFQ